MPAAITGLDPQRGKETARRLGDKDNGDEDQKVRRREVFYSVTEFMLGVCSMQCFVAEA